MENAFGILAGITLFAVIVALLEWLGRRKDRQSRDRAAQHRYRNRSGAVACGVYLASTSSIASRLGPSIITARVAPSL